MIATVLTVVVSVVVAKGTSVVVWVFDISILSPVTALRAIRSNNTLVRPSHFDAIFAEVLKNHRQVQDHSPGSPCANSVPIAARINQIALV